MLSHPSWNNFVQTGMPSKSFKGPWHTHMHRRHLLNNHHLRGHTALLGVQRCVLWSGALLLYWHLDVFCVSFIKVNTSQILLMARTHYVAYALLHWDLTITSFLHKNLRVVRHWGKAIPKMTACTKEMPPTLHTTYNGPPHLQDVIDDFG